MNYLITYDNTQTQFNAIDIHNTITNMSKIFDWWHYLPNVYIVSTSLFFHSKQITDIIMKAHSGLRFLVVKVDLPDHNGILNKDAWIWISRKTNINPKLKIVNATLPTITSLRVKPTNYSSGAIRTAIDELLRKK